MALWQIRIGILKLTVAPYYGFPPPLSARGDHAIGHEERKSFADTLAGAISWADSPLEFYESCAHFRLRQPRLDKRIGCAAGRSPCRPRGFWVAIVRK